MKKLFPYSLMAILILAVTLSGCGGGTAAAGPFPSPRALFRAQPASPPVLTIPALAPGELSILHRQA